MVKKLSFEKFKEIYSEVPRLCVEVFIKNDRGILLTLRDIDPYKGYWHFPGGTVLKGESLEETAVRVAEEELGIKVSPQKFLGIIQWGEDLHYPAGVFSVVCLSKIVSGEIKVDEQSKEARFFKELPSNIIPKHKEFLASQKLFE